MERVLLYLSVHVYTMEHHMYKGMCFNRGVVCGEYGDVVHCRNILFLCHPAVNLVFLVCAWEESGTALKTTAQVSSCFQGI